MHRLYSNIFQCLINDAKKRVVVLCQCGWFLTAPLGVGDAGKLRKSGKPHLTQSTGKSVCQREQLICLEEDRM